MTALEIARHTDTSSLFVWLWHIVNDRKFLIGIVFFSHTNQPVILLHKPATKTNQPTKHAAGVRWTHAPLFQRPSSTVSQDLQLQATKRRDEKAPHLGAHERRASALPRQYVLDDPARHTDDDPPILMQAKSHQVPDPSPSSSTKSCSGVSLSSRLPN